MTLPVTGSDKRFTDSSGRFYAGMKLEEAGDKRKMISTFNTIDEDQDGVLSYEEMFHDLGRDIEIFKHSIKTDKIICPIWIGCGLLFKKHKVALPMALFGVFDTIISYSILKKLNKTCEEWKKMYAEIEAQQTQQAA